MDTLQIGDLVDYRGQRGLRVEKVGFGTIWARTQGMQVVGARHEFKRSRGPDDGPMKVGVFTIERRPPGKVWLRRADGEAMETDEATLESLLEKFWRARF